MLTVEQMRAILDGLTYRPGWTMSIEENEHEGPYLRVVGETKNTYNENEDIDLGINTYLSPNDRRGEDAFLDFLVWRLVRIESHEAREWLRRDGVAIADPHIPG